MHEAASFWIPGTPVQQGSKKHVGKGIMVETAEGLSSWRVDVANAARAQRAKLSSPLDGYLIMQCDFYFQMPASRPKKVRDAGVWPKNTTPDGDKLLRSIGDAITVGNLIRDDARIFRYIGTKWETMGEIGAQVTLYTWEGPDDELR